MKPTVCDPCLARKSKLVYGVLKLKGKGVILYSCRKCVKGLRGITSDGMREIVSAAHDALCKIHNKEMMKAKAERK